MQDYAQIISNECSLKIGSTDVLNNPDNLNDVNSTEIIWTKETRWQTAVTRWSSFYTPIPPTKFPYVKVFRVGLVYAKTSLKHISGKGLIIILSYTYANHGKCSNFLA